MYFELSKTALWVVAIVAGLLSAGPAAAQGRPSLDTGPGAGPGAFDFTLGYTAVAHGASDVLDPQPTVASGSYDLGLTWRPGGWTVAALAEGGHVLGAANDEDLSANVGSALGVNEAFDTQTLAVTQLWAQRSMGGWTVRAGKLDVSERLDTNALANDEHTQFLASPLVNNPAVGLPEEGLGALAWREGEGWSVGLAAADALADAREVGFTTLGRGRLFVGGQLSLHPTSAGALRLIGWGANLPGDAGWGAALSWDHQLTPGVIALGRLGYSSGAAAAERFASLGVGAHNPFGRPGDLWALGAAWACFHDPSLGEETLVESFYRCQLGEHLAVSPGVQALTSPAEPAADAWVALAYVRVQVEY